MSVLDFFTNSIDTVTGTISGIGGAVSLALGVLGILLIFLVSQLLLFGQIWGIGWLFVKGKGILESTGIIPKARQIFG